MANKTEIDQIMSILARAYPYILKDSTANWTDTLMIYERTLADIDAPALLAAALDHITRNKFFPAISELRDAAYRVVTQDQPSAEEAWGEVRLAFTRYGHNNTPVWSHPLIERAVKVIGWMELCMSENQVADRAHFLRIYGSVEQRSKDAALTLPEIRDLTLKLSAGKLKELRSA